MIAIATSSVPYDMNDVVLATVLGDTVIVPWYTDHRWGQYEAVLVRSCWDYPHNTAAFHRWLDHLDAAGVRVLNTTSLIRWLMPKQHYLARLSAAGIPVVPTVHGEQNVVCVAEICAAQGWQTVILKPAIGASGHHVYRVNAHEAVAQHIANRLSLEPGGVLVQPFLSSVQRNGEWSLILLAGQYSHAVRKYPTLGEYRSNESFGGTAMVREPPAELITLAERAVAILPEPALIVRVDCLQYRHEWVISEIEGVSPYLYLQRPALIGRVAEVIAAAVRTHG